MKPTTRFPVKRLAATLAGIAALGGVLVAAGDTPLPLDVITSDRVVARLKFLASDSLEGRAPSTRGGELAAKYIAAQFAEIGLKPGGHDGTFLQPVPIVESKVDASSVKLEATGGERTEALEFLNEVVAFAGIQEPTVSVQADLIFVGYGVNAPEADWNDYAGADVRGKIVLALVNDPPASADEPERFGGTALTYYGRWTYKFEEAARQGAAGAILIHTTESAGYPFQVVQTSWSGTRYSLPSEPGQPALRFKAWVTNEAATTLTTLGGRNLDELRQSAARRGFTAVPLGVRVNASLAQTVSQKESPNVIGVLPGTAPEEGVVYTAHYDHFGMREPVAGESGDDDRIFNGALDNATGVAGIIAIAEAFARADSRPRRSVYFVATTAEESGLLGAEWFASHPPIPIDRLAANINVDGLNVLGPARDLVLLGSERSTLGDVARRLVEAQDRVLGTDADPEQGYFFRSDHFPLAKAGVPAVSISDSNEIIGKPSGYAERWRNDYNEKHYHQPSDEYDPTWNLEGAVADLRLLAALGWTVADEKAMPTYHPSEQFARPRASGR